MTYLTKEPVVIFTHAGRTGGDTFNAVLNNVYDRKRLLHFETTMEAWTRLRDLPDDYTSILKCIHGHGAPYGIGACVNRETTYTTICRDPVNRVISQYYIYYHDSTRQMHERIHREAISLEQYAQMNQNEMASYCLGRPYYWPYEPHLNHLPKLFDIMESHFSFIGITEYYDETVFLAHKHFGWKELYFWTKSLENKKRPALEEVPEQTRSLIEQLNLVDRALYNYAFDRFQSELKNLSDEEAAALQEYRESQQVFVHLLNAGVELVNQELHRVVLQKKGMKIAILLSVPELKVFFQNYFELLNQNFGRAIDYKIYHFASSRELNRILENIEFPDYTIGVPQPGEELQLRELLKTSGARVDRLAFVINY